MSKLNIEVPDKLLIEMRKLIIDKHGTLKGNMANAVEEALRDYLIKNGRQGNCRALLPILA
jgi:hypothetical protein